MIVSRLGGKIIRTVLYCVGTTVVHNDTHTDVNISYILLIGLGSNFVYVCSFRFTVLFFSLDQFISVLLAFVFFGLVFFSAKPRDWLGRNTLK